MKRYRALISIPIEANSDDDALTVANEQAASVRHPDGAIAGHVELVGEARNRQMDALEAGLIYLPSTIVTFLVSAATANAMTRIPLRLLLGAGLAILAVGS